MISVVSVHDSVHNGGGPFMVKSSASWVMVTWGLTPPPPSSALNMFKLVHYEARAVGSRAVGTPLECFLFLRKGNIFTSVCQEFCPRGGARMHSSRMHTIRCSAPWADIPPPGRHPSSWADTPCADSPGQTQPPR